MRMNSIISWVGGKKALRELIYQRMPKEFGWYIEVFGGGGWVLFGRTPDTVMEVYNDLIPTSYVLLAIMEYLNMSSTELAFLYLKKWRREKMKSLMWRVRTQSLRPKKLAYGD